MNIFNVFSLIWHFIWMLWNRRSLVLNKIFIYFRSLNVEIWSTRLIETVKFENLIIENVVLHKMRRMNCVSLKLMTLYHPSQHPKGCTLCEWLLILMTIHIALLTNHLRWSFNKAKTKTTKYQNEVYIS